MSCHLGQVTSTDGAKTFISQQTYEGLQIITHSTMEAVNFLLSHSLNSVLTETLSTRSLG